MPGVVAHGRPPEVYACGYCHMSAGQGRPENASLAGLPAPYILQELIAFKSGSRRSASQGPHPPTNLMIHVSQYSTAEEMSSAAKYFSLQTPKSHVTAPDEPLGKRLLEFAPDIGRHENRDEEMQYIAYVPMGSIRRGRFMATRGARSSAGTPIARGPRL